MPRSRRRRGKPRRPSSTARVRVPDEQPQFIHIPGEHGGWYISLLWHHGSAVTITWPQLRRLLAGTRGEIVIARRLIGGELRMLDEYRRDIGSEVHARTIYRDDMRWTPPRRRR